METKISAKVPLNSLNGILEQLNERENLIFKKIAEIEAFREKVFFLLFLGFIIIFFLLFLNIYFVYRWRKAYNILLKNPKKGGLNVQNLILNYDLKNKNSFCQIKNCFFYYQKRYCSLMKLGERVIEFSQKLSKNFKNETLINQLLKLGEYLNQNCYFKNNNSEKESPLVLKKKLKKLRYHLNKIKKNPEIDSSFRQEARLLWQISHQITLIIVKWQKIID